jgi:hypothetical protein
MRDVPSKLRDGTVTNQWLMHGYGGINRLETGLKTPAASVELLGDARRRQ